MLPAGLRDLARARAEEKLPDTCVVYQVGVTYDADGEEVATFTVRHAGIDCRAATLSGSEALRAQQVAADATGVVTLAHDTVLGGTDRIVVTKAETGEVQDFEVQHINKRSVEITRRVLCRELTP